MHPSCNHMYPGKIEYRALARKSVPPGDVIVPSPLSGASSTVVDGKLRCEFTRPLTPMLQKVSPWQHHSSLPRAPRAGSPGSWLRYGYSLRTSRWAAQGPMGACSAAVRPGQSRRLCGFQHPGSPATALACLSLLRRTLSCYGQGARRPASASTTPARHSTRCASTGSLRGRWGSRRCRRARGSHRSSSVARRA